MKTFALIGWLAIAVAGGVCNAQFTQPSPVAGSGGGDYAVTAVGPHSLTWQNSAGQTVMQIQTGLNYQTNGQWSASVNSFSVSPDGGSFVANQIQDPTRIAGNINTLGAVTATTPNGVTLQSTPVAVGLYDTKSGLSVILAKLTNSYGVMVDPQHIVFTNALVGSGLAASVVYSLPDTGSFHQDVIFTSFQTNFDPTAYGFAADSTNTLEVQIFTEFYGNVPQPNLMERDLYIETNQAVRASMATPDYIDYTLDFGNYVFIPGRCYSTTPDVGFADGVTVAKDFVTDSSGRTFLVESVRYQSLAGALESLPAIPMKTSSLKPRRTAKRMMVAAASLPPLQVDKGKPDENLKAARNLASAVKMPKGVAVDYIVTVSGTGPVVYSSDTTYFVSGNVYNTGPVTMESCVFKYPTTNIGAIEVESTLTMATTNYRTAIFTGADDDTCGSTLSNIWSGYTGIVGTNRYGNVGLHLATSDNIVLNNLRFCYMNTAIEVNADTRGQTLSLWDLLLVDCVDGIFVNGGNGTNTNTNSATLTLTVNNCLMANVGTEFQTSSIILTANAYDCTVDSSAKLFNIEAYTYASFTFNNSIFSSLASKGTLGTLALIGGSNVFYNCIGATFGTFNTVTLSPYVTNGAGYYYITNNSPYLTNGSTSIPASLLAHLATKTTQAPDYFSPSPLPFSTIATPVVNRDLSGIALGFHYDAIDFLTVFTIAPTYTLTLTNGVVFAYYGSGITLGQHSHLISQGSPNQRNYLVYYSLVQEEPISFLGYSLPGAQPITPDPASASNYPSVFLRFTTICAPTGETNLLNSGDFSALPQSVNGWTNRDCEIYGSGAVWQMSEVTNAPNVEFTNNLFYRVPFAINSKAIIASVNNLFYETTNVATNSTTISILHYGGGSHNTNENDVFDGVVAALDGTNGHNAYLHGATNTNNSTNNTDLWTNVTWVAGTFGNYYQPTNSPLLTNGSTNASNLGLFHYTVLTDNAPEGSNVVSRGYHYVAAGTNGLPLDSNNDGLPDYLEDFNGDGTNDDGEQSWNSSTSPWIGTQPVNQYAVAATPATFSVTAYGTAPLSYQWMTNGAAINLATASSYTISSAPSSDAWTYTVKVSNSSSNVTSSGATLTIIIPPQVTNTFPPTNGEYWFQTNYDELSTDVTNSYYGSPAPAYYSEYLNPYLQYMASYQWELNGANIPFASGMFVGVDYVAYKATNDGGTNTVVITNPVGSTNVTWTNVVLAAPGMVEAWGTDEFGECNRPVWLTNAIAIAAGEYQSIAVTDAGSVVQWGRYTNGSNMYAVTNTAVATQPPTSGVVAVAAGYGQALALLSSNGTVTAWGLTNDPSSTVPLGLVHTNMIAVACGFQFNVELNTNGTVVAWGLNPYGQTNVPRTLTNVTAIAAGAYHVLAVSNGIVVAWGNNTSGQCNVPSTLTNVVAVAAGYGNSLALQSNGVVVAWGNTNYGQTNVPAAASQGNVMAIAAGDYFCAALLNNGTIVEWGMDNAGQTNVPQSNPTNPVVVKLLAAAGGHTMAAIFSSWVQYPVNVSKDLLLICNTNSNDSTNVCQYYLTHRPMVSGANVLRIGCQSNNETISPADYTNVIAYQVRTWLTNNPTKRPSYVILFQDIPSRVNTNGEGSMPEWPSVQYQLRYWCSPGWYPFVTAINMNITNEVTDCEAYINKLQAMGSNLPGQLFLSGTASGIANTHYYFDDSRNSNYFSSSYGNWGSNAVVGVLAANPSASVTYTNVTPDSGLTNHLTNGFDVAGYFSWGSHSVLTNGYATNGYVKWTGTNGWWIIKTADSYNGDRIASAEGNFLSWYATNAFDGTNYGNTPVAAVSTVDEPGNEANFDQIYFGLWESGDAFAICAWNSLDNFYPQNLGDPFVTK